MIFPSESLLLDPSNVIAVFTRPWYGSPALRSATGFWFCDSHPPPPPPPPLDLVGVPETESDRSPSIPEISTAET